MPQINKKYNDIQSKKLTVTNEVTIDPAVSFQIDTISENTSANGVTVADVLNVDVIAESTAATGVTIDGVLNKDGQTDAGRVSQELTATGAFTLGSGLALLNHASVIIEATLAAPAVGDDLVIVDSSATGTAAHTVTTAAGVTFDGTNNTATFNLLGETLHVVALSATRWLILENIGTVGLSSV